MASPFRNNKEERKRLRREASAIMALGDKCEIKGIPSNPARQIASILAGKAESKRKTRNMTSKPEPT
jgi:hypothetical protein